MFILPYRDMDQIRFAAALATVMTGALTVTPAPAGQPSSNLRFAQQLNEAFVEVVEKVSPAVVVIDVVQKAGADSIYGNDEGALEGVPPELRRFFRERFGQHGEGSGVIIRSDGYILTNGHVVDQAETIKVRLKDGRVFPATIRGVDSQSDIAVLKIDSKGLPVASLGDSSRTRVGEFAIAIGAPFDLDYSVTFGHISAKGRSNVIRGYEAQGLDQDYLQTDALINPGNSGGPLLNINSEVIGINTMIRGLHSGIGFAIPSNLAKEVSDKLISDGKFMRPWLGVEIRALRDDPQVRETLHGVDEGVVVERILPGGPAAKSDLVHNDIISAVDGMRVATAQELRTEIRRKSIGKPVNLEVYRPDSRGNCKVVKVQVKLGEWSQPVTTVASIRRSLPSDVDPSGLGLTVHILTSEIAREIGIEMTNGVLVVGVDKDTPAARRGIQPGDVITAVDKQPTTSPRAFRDAVKAADLKKGVTLNLVTASKARVEILKEEEK